MYLTGRTSKFSVGGLDSFLPGNNSTDATIRDLTGILAHDSPQYATDAELWNAVADALVAVQRKFTLSDAAINVGIASAVAYRAANVNDPDARLYIADSVHDQVLVFNIDGSFIAAFKASTVPGALDVAVNDSNPANVLIYVVNSKNQTIDTYTEDGVLKERFKPASIFKPLAVGYVKGEGYDYIYVVNNSTGARNVEVYDAATKAYKGLITTMGIKVRKGLDGKLYLIRNDAAIYRIQGLTAVKLANVPVRDSYVDIAADAAGYVYILDRTAKIIRKFNSVGTELASEAINSAGTAWEFMSVQGLALDPDSKFYIADNGIVKRVVSGDYVDSFAADSIIHESVEGSCLVIGPMARPLTTADAPIYPGNTGAYRWKSLVTSVNPSGSVLMNKATNTYTKDINVEFIVNSPAEIVWPADIRTSVRGTGTNARAYFKKIPNGTTEGLFATTLSDGKIKLRYIFTICQLSPAFRQPLDGTYIVDALGYVSKL